MAAIFMKKDDTKPHISATLKDASGDVVDLTTASGVKFIMTLQGGSTAKVDSAGVITDAANGVVGYAWSTGDTDTSGVYNAEFEVNWGSSVYQTFPAIDYLEVTIQDDLGGDV